MFLRLGRFYPLTAKDVHSKVLNFDVKSEQSKGVINNFVRLKANPYHVVVQFTGG